LDLRGLTNTRAMREGGGLGDGVRGCALAARGEIRGLDRGGEGTGWRVDDGGEMAKRRRKNNGKRIFLCGLKLKSRVVFKLRDYM